MASLACSIHWGVYSLLGKGEWVMDHDKLPAREYAKLPPRFNPSKFDAEAWVKLAKEAGKYSSITGKPRRLLHVRQPADRFRCRRRHALSSRPAQGTGRAAINKRSCSSCTIPSSTGAIRLFPAGKDRRERRVVNEKGTGNGTSLSTRASPRAVHQLRRDRRDLARWLVGPARRRLGPPRDVPVDPRAATGRLVGNNHHVAPFPGEGFEMFEQDVPGENAVGLDNAGGSPELPLETCLTMNRSSAIAPAIPTGRPPDKSFMPWSAARTSRQPAAEGRAAQPDGTIGPDISQRLHEVGTWLGAHGETVYGTRRGPIPPQSWGVSTARGPAGTSVRDLPARSHAQGWCTDHLRSIALMDSAPIRQGKSLDLDPDKGWPGHHPAQRGSHAIDSIIVLSPKTKGR